jgi:hypothetical protein
MPDPTLLDSLNEFDPNANGPLYASYSPQRHPAWKTHSSRQQLLAVMYGWRYMAFYTQENGKWKLLARKAIEDHNHTCSWCHGTTLSTHSSSWNAPLVSPDVYDDGLFVWRKSQGKVVDPPVLDYLCQACYRA